MGRTLQWYTEALGFFDRFRRSQDLGPDLNTVTPLHVRLWLAHLQDAGLSKSTVNNRFRALRAFFNWCVVEGLIDGSPMRNIRTPSLGKPIVPVFSPQHIKALLFLCLPNVWWGARDRAIILTFLHTGIRLSELTSVTLQDVDFTNDCMKVHGKGNKERTIYLALEAQRAIVQHLRYWGDTGEHL